MKIEKSLFVKIIILFILFVLLFLILFISIKNVRTNNKAVKCFNKGSFESAAQTFDNELKNNPKNYVVINNSAGADYKLNKLDEARTKYSVVINSTDVTKEDKFTALYNSGNVEFLKNNFEKSIDFYKKALKLNPNDKDAKYNLELVLLKLNEKNNKQDGKYNKQKNDKQNQQAQDFKKQMEQNDKAQKENDEKCQEKNDKNRDNKNSSHQRSNDSKQKELEKEKKELDKQKQEISDKIKNLMDAQKEEESQKNKQTNKSDPMQQNKIKKDVNEDIQATMLLNYYNEADKNSNKVKNKNKEPLINQPREDW